MWTAVALRSEPDGASRVRLTGDPTPVSIPARMETHVPSRCGKQVRVSSATSSWEHLNPLSRERLSLTELHIHGVTERKYHSNDQRKTKNTRWGLASSFGPQGLRCSTGVVPCNSLRSLGTSLLFWGLETRKARRPLRSSFSCPGCKVPSWAPSC